MPADSYQPPILDKILLMKIIFHDEDDFSLIYDDDGDDDADDADADADDDDDDADDDALLFLWGSQDAGPVASFSLNGHIHACRTHVF